MAKEQRVSHVGDDVDHGNGPVCLKTAEEVDIDHLGTVELVPVLAAQHLNTHA